MAQSNQLNAVTLIAGSAVPIYRYVTVAADGKVDLTSTNLLSVDGCSGDAAAADGDALTVVLPAGIMKMEAGAAVTRGAAQMSDGTGRTIDLVAGASKYITGVALDAAAGAGEIIRVLMNPHQDVA